MADQLSSLPSTASSSVLPALSGTLSGQLNNLTSGASSILDRFFPPAQRDAMKSKLTAFATEKPMLASFLFSQVALSSLPLALFFIMSLTVVVFALLAGILVGVLGALLFIVFAVGVALIFLLPVLFLTTFSAVAIWLWGVGAYYILKWFNGKEIPGVHGPLGEGLKEKFGIELPGLSGGGAGESGGVGNGDVKRGGDVKQVNGTAGRDGHRENGKADGGVGEKTPLPQKKRPKQPELSAKTPTKVVTNPTEGVTDVGKGVTGLVA